MDKVADEGGNIDKLLSKLDTLGTRMDALETGTGSKNPLKADKGRKDDDDDDDKKKDDEFPPKEKEEEEKKDDDDEGEQDPDKKAPPPSADKKKDARKDQGASMPPPAAKSAAPPPPRVDKKKDDDDDDDKKKDDDDDDDDAKRRDAALKADAVERRAMKKRLDAQDAEIRRLNALMKPRTDDEHAAFADTQARADVVFAGFGKHAPRPLEGETHVTYRKRLATLLKSHSPQWSKVKFSQLPDAAFEIAEKTVYADATAAAANPTDLEDGELREVTHTDPRTGLKTNFFYGKESFVKSMGRPARRVTGIRTHFPN
jgi:hypothetical protein